MSPRASRHAWRASCEPERCSTLAAPNRRSTTTSSTRVWVAPDGAFSIAAAVWNVGQVTPVHDHGTWGVIGIYGGVEHEIRYRLAAQPGPGRLSLLSERDIAAGQVIVCCTSDQDIHRVSCGSNVPCVGIHVYGADIGTIPRHVYDPETGQARTFVSAWTALDDPS